MKKKLAIGFAAIVLAIPVIAAADTTVQSQLISLYQQLIQLLQHEITFLTQNTLSVSPASGTAPLSVTFTLAKSYGNESIDFGDGHSTGSSGCATNSQGFCDLTKPVSHTYTFPGSYKVTLYRGADPKAVVVTTQTVTVQKI
jgi:hypothetical protein